MRIRMTLAVPGACVLAATALIGQQTPQNTNPLANDAAAVASGRDLYGQICQSCHGPAGQGSDRGPALATTALSHGNTDPDLFRSIRSGVPGTQMAGFPGLSDSDVWRIVAYLRTLQTSGSSTPLASGDPIAGEALFFGAAGCASCHEVHARGGIVGPDLSGAGSLSPAALRLKIVDPNNPAARTTARGSRGGAAPATVIVKTNDGREIRGVRRNEDTFSLQMIDLSGQLHLLDKRALASVVIDEKSLHPPDYKTAVVGIGHHESRFVLADAARTRCQRRPRQVPPLAGGVTYERLLKSKAEPHNWLMYWGDYQGTHYSALSSITPANVAQLRAAWSATVPGDDGEREHAARGRRRHVRHQRRQPSNRDGDRCSNRPANLAIRAAAESPQSRRDRRRQSRRRDTRASIVRRNQRRRTCSASMRGPDCCCGKSRWQTRWRASTSRARRSSSRTRSSLDTRAASTRFEGSSMHTTSWAIVSGGSTPFLRPVSSAATPGKETAGKPAAGAPG